MLTLLVVGVFLTVVGGLATVVALQRRTAPAEIAAPCLVLCCLGILCSLVAVLLKLIVEVNR